ncbi:MAG: preprotein translocase subunit SecE [Mycobacterium leprae]
MNNWVAATRTYLKDVRGEVTKVSWPSWELLWKHTGIVVAMVVIISAFLFILDYPLGLGLQKLVAR